MASQALAVPSIRPALSVDAMVPAVLVVDHELHSVVHCTRMLDELGYPNHGATSGRQALEMLGQHPGIQILLADLDMPSMGGFALIEEARVRAGERRPIAAVMVTAKPSVELAIRGMHLEAVDMLPKPFGLDAYSSALRRAMRYIATRRAAVAETGVSGFGEQLARLVAALEGKREGGANDGDVSDREVASTLRLMISSRTIRARYFPTELFADPAWDILLDLTRAELEKQHVSVSSVCIAASVPMSTALRWVRQMTDAGLLRRWTDPKDRRRDLIALTPSTAGNMKDYLTAVHVNQQKA
jgi:CheY-like chemotaxis protein